MRQIIILYIFVLLREIKVKIDNNKSYIYYTNEEVLSDNGKIDPAKLHALIFDQFQNGYYAVGKKVGQAWNAGKDLMKK